MSAGNQASGSPPRGRDEFSQRVVDPREGSVQAQIVIIPERRKIIERDAQAASCAGWLARCLLRWCLLSDCWCKCNCTGCPAYQYEGQPVSGFFHLYSLFEQAACWHHDDIPGSENGAAFDAVARTFVIVAVSCHHACFTVCPPQFYAFLGCESGQATGFGQNLKDGCTGCCGNFARGADFSHDIHISRWNATAQPPQPP